MPDETRTLFFTALDEEGHRLVGALVRFYVDNKLRTEGKQQADKPVEFKISSKVEFVDVEIIYANERVWTKVSMADGFAEFRLHVSPAAPPPTPAPPPVTPAPVLNGNDPTPDPPPWRAAAVWVAVITAVSAIVVAAFQYGPKSCAGSTPPSPTPVQTVKFRVQVLDLDHRSPLGNAHIGIVDGASHQDDYTGDDGLTKPFVLSRSSQASLALSVHEDNYADVSRNLDRPTEDQTYTVELKAAKPSRPGPTPRPAFILVVPGTWTIQGIGDPNNERVTRGTVSFTKTAQGKAILTGHISIDNMDVTLTGTCEWQGREMHWAYNAATSGGGSWSGSADLTAESATKVSGRVQSKRGDDAPILLLKD